MQAGTPLLFLLFVSCGSKKQESVWRTSCIDSSGTSFGLVISGASDGTPLIGVFDRTPREKQPRLTRWRTEHERPGHHGLWIDGRPVAAREEFVLFVDDSSGKPLQELTIPRDEVFRLYKDKLTAWDGPTLERFWNEVVRPRLKP